MFKNCRQFFRLYPQIRQPAVGDLSLSPAALLIGQPAVGESDLIPISSPPVDKSLPTPLATQSLLRLSRAHSIELIRLDDPRRRAFYEKECASLSARSAQSSLAPLRGRCRQECCYNGKGTLKRRRAYRANEN